MDIYEAIYTTRAMRRLKPDPIPYDVQARILDAAIHAPHIGEGWHFVLVDDPEIKSQLAPLYRQGFERMVGGPPEELFADVIKTVYLPTNQRWSESRVYFLVVWSVIAAGSLILLSGVNQPLLLLTISACLSGMVMFVYSILLIQLNRRGLPPAIRVRGVRLAMLVVATLFYGFFSGWLVIVQVQSYLAQG